MQGFFGKKLTEYEFIYVQLAIKWLLSKSTLIEKGCALLNLNDRGDNLKII